MSAQIVMDSGSPVTGSIEVAAGVAVNLSNFDNTNVLGWDWQVFDKPTGSTAVLSAQYASTSQLTGDISGTYVLRLVTYQDAARTIIDDADEQAMAVRYAKGYPWRVPGAGETLQFSATVGWKPDANLIFDDLHDYMLRPTALKTASSAASFGEMVLVNLAGAGGNVTITPPTAVGKIGKRIGMKIVGAASGRQAIFNPFGSETIDGSATLTLSTDNAYATFQSDDANWQRVG